MAPKLERADHPSRTTSTQSAGARDRQFASRPREISRPAGVEQWSVLPNARPSSAPVIGRLAASAARLDLPSLEASLGVAQVLAGTQLLTDLHRSSIVDP